MTAPSPDGEGARRAMQLCLADNAVDPARVGYVNAHGTSTPLGDVAETSAVKQVFGDHARNLIFGSSKSMTGHLLGAAGAVEFGVALLAATTGQIPPTINQTDADPDCDLFSAPNQMVERPIDVALSTPSGSGPQRDPGRQRLSGVAEGLNSPRPGGVARLLAAPPKCFW